MPRWVGVAAVLALLAVGFYAYNNENQPMLGLYGGDLSRLVLLVLLLLLATGAGYGFMRVRHSPRNVLLGALFWAGMLALIALGYAAFVK